MKIVGWAELSKMPPGTIFQGISPYHTGDLQILGDVWKGTALIAAPLLPTCCGVETLSLKDAELARIGVTDHDVVVFTPTGNSRDHGPGASKQWLVWEKADRERLAGWLLNPIMAASQMNDDPHMIMKVEEDPA